MRPADSAEHILPDWLRRSVPREGRALFEYGSGLQRRHTEGTPFDFTVDCLCTHCNRRWMSAIEGRAKDALLPMILGTRIELSPVMQQNVATWVFKTCLIYQTAFPGVGSPIPDEHFRHLYTVRKRPKPPERTQIWLGAYSDARHSRGDYHSADRSSDGSVHPASLKAYSASLVVGHLEMQVFATFGYDQNAADFAVRGLGVFNDAQIPIWPVSDVSLTWPPPMWLDDRSLDALIGIFRGTPPDW